MSEQTFRNRIKNAWNVFKLKEDISSQSVTSFNMPSIQYNSYGLGSPYRPGIKRLGVSNERSIVAAMYNHIAIDVAAVKIQHVKTDKNGKFLETISSSLNECLSIEANIDQTGRQLILDVVLSMFDEGVVALVPVDTSVDMNKSASFDILSMRVGKILEWFPEHIKINLYNDRKGINEEITLPKSKVGIIENPFYAIMNEPNSTLKRLIHKLNLLDMIDEQSGYAKLDIILQLPYTIKTPARREEAEKRRKQIEEQLNGSKYGIAYTDGTEKITQLNRSLDNNLLNQIENLQNTLYSQLGITKEVFDGKADEATMLNYYNRTVEPILSAIVDEMKRKFLTKTARTQGQSIMFFRDAFKLVPVNEIASIADKFTRNEILSSNEMRSVIGYRPVDDPKADELRNKNINQSVQSELGGNFPVTTNADMGVGPSEEVGDLAESPDDILGQIAELEEYLKVLYDANNLLSDEELEQMDKTEDYFAHYASKYYDPVKAHEYYERTKQLKGRIVKRASASTLNDKGKSAAQVVKENINKEKTAEITQQKNLMKSKVSALYSRLKTVGKMRRGEEKAKITEEVKKLTEEFSDIQSKLKEKYENIYYEELEKMNADSEFAGVKKTTGSSGKKSSSKKSSSKKSSSKSKSTSNGNKWDQIIANYWKRRNGQ